MQLFSFRIGAAQAAKGASVISTNTDGLYSVMEKTINDKILEQEAASIHVDIEPEPLFLISKDTNNRIELTEDLNTIISASGGTVGCRKGPNPEKSLAHPAIIDWALTEYLIACAKNEGKARIDKPFDEETGRRILTEKAKAEFKDPAKYLQMFQNVIASSPSSTTYIYGLTDDEPYDPIIMQHYNRAFYMKDLTENTVHLYAATARTMTPAEQKTWKTQKADTKKDERIACLVLAGNGESVDIIKTDTTKRIVSKKVTNVDPEWPVKIDNSDLYLMPEEKSAWIMDNLDTEKYLSLLKSGFEDNWMNVLPAPEELPDEIKEYLTFLMNIARIENLKITIPADKIQEFIEHTETLFDTDNLSISPEFDFSQKTFNIDMTQLPFRSLDITNDDLIDFIKTAA